MVCVLLPVKGEVSDEALKILDTLERYRDGFRIQVFLFTENSPSTLPIRKMMRKTGWIHYRSPEDMEEAEFLRWAYALAGEQTADYFIQLNPKVTIQHDFLKKAVAAWQGISDGGKGALSLVGQKNADSGQVFPIQKLGECFITDARRMGTILSWVSDETVTDISRMFRQKRQPLYRVAHSLISGDLAPPAPLVKAPSYHEIRDRIREEAPQETPRVFTGNKVATFMMATHYRPLLLKASLQHLMNQRIPPGWELEVLVCGNPQDPGRQVVAALGKPFRYISVPNLTVTSKLNACLAQAQESDLILLADDDDLQPEDRVQRSIESLARGYNCSGVGTIFFYDLFKDRLTEWKGDAKKGLIGTGMSFKGEIVRQVGGWPERAKGKDGALMARLSREKTPVIFEDLTEKMGRIIALQHAHNIWERNSPEKGEKSVKGSFNLTGFGMLEENPIRVCPFTTNILKDLCSPENLSELKKNKEQFVVETLPKPVPFSRKKGKTKGERKREEALQAQLPQEPLPQSPDVVITMIVLNEMEFLEKNIKQHLSWPGLQQIIIVEGSTKTYGATNPHVVSPQGLSTDGTTEYLIQLAEENPLITYIPYGWTSGPLAQGKKELRNAYCQEIKKYNPYIFVAIDADEFYCYGDQIKINEVVRINPKYESWLFPLHDVWKPPQMADTELFKWKVIGGYWRVPHTKVWKWSPGTRYLLDHIHPSRPGGVPKKTYRIKGISPACIHLGFARDPGHRKRTNAYYVARGEGKEKTGKNRQTYVDCRGSWETWTSGQKLPHGGQVIPYTYQKPEILNSSTAKTGEYKIGLHGYCCPTGLGYENKRMWANLPFEKWLIYPHKKLGVEGKKGLPRSRNIRTYYKPSDIDIFLEGLDAVVCVERPMVLDLFAKAKAKGIKTVLLVNIEWFDLKRPPIDFVDVLISRNEFGHLYLKDFVGEKHEHKVVRGECPLDLKEWKYQQRNTANSFLFTNGWGGFKGRKGWEVVDQAIPLLPQTV